MSQSEKFVLLADNKKSFSEIIEKGNHPKVENIHWTLNVTAATDTEPDIMKPRALLHLKLSDPVPKRSSCTVMDFDENELFKFYEVLEDIQEKLDTINKEQDVLKN